MTKALRWPNVMKNHRDRAAQDLQKAERLLMPLVVQEVELDRTAIIRRQAAALALIQTALRHLEQAGAPTKPD
jgi:hypothetical protein